MNGFGSAAETPFWRRVNSRIENGLLLRGSHAVLHAFCGADDEGHHVIGVT
jgi:hypothetical protein